MLNQLQEPIQTPIRTDEAFNQPQEPILIETFNPKHEPDQIILALEAVGVPQEVAATISLHRVQGTIQTIPRLCDQHLRLRLEVQPQHEALLLLEVLAGLHQDVVADRKFQNNLN